MAKMHTMKSMELDDEEKIDACCPIPCSKPDYPYGLRICLTEAEFKKLDLNPADASIGGIFHLHGLARITSISMSDSSDGQCCRVEAQIEDLEIESEDDENREY